MFAASNWLDFPGKAATAVIGFAICIGVFLGVREIAKSYGKHGMFAAGLAAVGCGVVLFIIANLLKIPGLTGDVSKEVEKKQNQIKSKIPIGGSMRLIWDGQRLR